jgi:hypothetical protein
MFSGQDEKKKEYRPVSAQYLDSVSRSKNSPIGIPHNLRAPYRLDDLHWRTPRPESEIYPSIVCVVIPNGLSQIRSFLR